MTGVAGLTCPECGRDAKCKKRLFKMRRRPVIAGFGLLLVLAGLGGAATPKIQRDGALSFVLTSVLLVLVPDAGEEFYFDSKGRFQRNIISEELKKRRLTLSAWQWRYVIERKRVILTRPRWCVGEEVRAAMISPRWMGLSRIEVSPILEEADGIGAGSTFPHHSFEFTVPAEKRQVVGRFDKAHNIIRAKASVDIGQRTEFIFSDSVSVWSGEIAFPTVISDVGGPSIQPFIDSRFDNRLSDSLWASVKRYPQGGGLFSLSAPLMMMRDHRTTLVSVKMEILRDGVPFATREDVMWDGGATTSHVARHRDVIAIHLGSDLLVDAIDMSGVPDRDHSWVVRLTGSRGDSLAVACDRYWVGTIELPLAELLERAQGRGW